MRLARCILPACCSRCPTGAQLNFTAATWCDLRVPRPIHSFSRTTQTGSLGSLGFTYPDGRLTYKPSFNARKNLYTVKPEESIARSSSKSSGRDSRRNLAPALHLEACRSCRLHMYQSFINVLTSSHASCGISVGWTYRHRSAFLDDLECEHDGHRMYAPLFQQLRHSASGLETCPIVKERVLCHHQPGHTRFEQWPTSLADSTKTLCA